MPEPKRLRLLRVTKDGYLVGSGEVRKNTHLLIPHALTGLVDDAALAHEVDAVSEQAEGVAWRLGVCSFDKDHRAIPHSPASLRFASE